MIKTLSLSILIWASLGDFSATGEGAGVGRMSSVFLFGWEECIQSSVLL